MSVRKTESRLPQGLQATDLGEAIVAPDGRCALVSYTSSPLAAGRENMYVVFITDVGLAGSVHSFEWTFIENGGTPAVSSTDFGQQTYTAAAEGSLDIGIRMLDAGAAEQASISFSQDIGPLNDALETLIADANNNPGPGMGNPDVLRELVNDLNPYYGTVLLTTPEAGNGFKKFLFSTINDGLIQRKAPDRYYQLDQVAASLNSGETDFVSSIAPGLGVAAVRLSLVAMMLPPASIPYTELPPTSAENAAADEQIRIKLGALSENDRIDMFNLVRFPKSNVKLCGKLLEALRDKFFAGVNFDDVLAKMSGTMGDWIILNYNKGPLKR